MVFRDAVNILEQIGTHTFNMVFRDAVNILEQICSDFFLGGEHLEHNFFYSKIGKMHSF